MSSEKTGREFGRFKWQWIDQVVADRKLPPTALHVAWLLASRFLNKDTLEAWPAQATLSEVLGVEERQVRNLTDALKSRGHLVVKRGGRGKSNRYRPVLLTGNVSAGQKHNMTGNGSAGYESSLTGNPSSLDRQSDAVRPVMGMPPNLLIEPTVDEPASGSGPTARQPSPEALRLSSESVLSETSRRDGFESHPRAVIDQKIEHDDLGLCVVQKVKEHTVLVQTMNGEIFELYDQGCLDLRTAEFCEEAPF